MVQGGGDPVSLRPGVSSRHPHLGQRTASRGILSYWHFGQVCLRQMVALAEAKISFTVATFQCPPPHPPHPKRAGPCPSHTRDNRASLHGSWNGNGDRFGDARLPCPSRTPTISLRLPSTSPQGSLGIPQGSLSKSYACGLPMAMGCLARASPLACPQ